MTAYYNEIDPKAAACLRELIAQGHIAPGVVDERSIEDVTPADLAGFTQCHFFAGIGVWSYALRCAGWPDDRPVWTGSCPCQPFSAAGKGGGFADERHLWPAFHWLIEQCRPPVVFGEQVASKDGLGWLDLVQADLEGTGYASRAVDLCAAGVGAPHIRQRLWWVAERLDDTAGPRQHGPVAGAEGTARDDTWLRLSGTGRGPVGMADAPSEQHDRAGSRRPGRGPEHTDGGATGGLGDDDEGLEGQRGGHYAPVGRDRQVRPVAEAGQSGGLADPHDAERRADAPGRHDSRGQDTGREEGSSDAEGRGGLCGLANANGASRSGQFGLQPEGRSNVRQTGDWAQSCAAARLERPGPTNGVWRSADWLFCRDGKWRPVEPGAQPLAHGAAARVGRLRGYGNAIVAPAAQAFIKAYEEARLDRLRLTELYGMTTDDLGVFG